MESMRDELLATLAKVEGDIAEYSDKPPSTGMSRKSRGSRVGSRQSERPPPTGASGRGLLSASGRWHRGFTPPGGPAPRPATVSPYPVMGHVTLPKLPPRSPMPMGVNGLPRTPQRLTLYNTTRRNHKLVRASVPFAGNGGDGEPSKAGEVRWVELSKQRVDVTNGAEVAHFAERFEEALKPAKYLWDKRQEAVRARAGGGH